MQDTPTLSPSSTPTAPVELVPEIVQRARSAMAAYAREIAAEGQARIDEAVTALAWSTLQARERAPNG